MAFTTVDKNDEKIFEEKQTVRRKAFLSEFSAKPCSLSGLKGLIEKMTRRGQYDSKLPVINW